MRRLLCIVLLVLTAACGDDDDATATDVDETTSSTTTVGDETTASGPSTTAATTTTAAGADETPAAAPPGDGGDEGDGRDALVLAADLSGTGSGRAELVPSGDGYCIDMETVGLSSEVTDAHVHEGAEGVDGDVVVPIGPPTTVDGATETWGEVCVAVDEALRERLESEPASFYVNVHSADQPSGAVRGQLRVSTIFDRTLS